MQNISVSIFNTEYQIQKLNIKKLEIPNPKFNCCIILMLYM